MFGSDTVMVDSLCLQSNISRLKKPVADWSCFDEPVGWWVFKSAMAQLRQTELRSRNSCNQLKGIFILHPIPHPSSFFFFFFFPPSVSTLLPWGKHSDPWGTTQPNSLPGAPGTELKTGCMLNTYQMLLWVCVCVEGWGLGAGGEGVSCSPLNPSRWCLSVRLLVVFWLLSGLSMFSCMMIFISPSKLQMPPLPLHPPFFVFEKHECGNRGWIPPTYAHNRSKCCLITPSPKDFGRQHNTSGSSRGWAQSVLTGRCKRRPEGGVMRLQLKVSRTQSAQQEDDAQIKSGLVSLIDAFCCISLLTFDVIFVFGFSFSFLCDRTFVFVFFPNSHWISLSHL